MNTATKLQQKFACDKIIQKLLLPKVFLSKENAGAAEPRPPPPQPKTSASSLPPPPPQQSSFLFLNSKGIDQMMAIRHATEYSTTHTHTHTVTLTYTRMKWSWQEERTGYVSLRSWVISCFLQSHFLHSTSMATNAEPQKQLHDQRFALLSTIHPAHRPLEIGSNMSVCSYKLCYRVLSKYVAVSVFEAVVSSSGAILLSRVCMYPWEK